MQHYAEHYSVLFENSCKSEKIFRNRRYRKTMNNNELNIIMSHEQVHLFYSEIYFKIDLDITA